MASQKARPWLRSSALVVVLAVLSSSCRAATTCAEQVQAAVKTVTGDGVGVSCCKPDSADCKLSIIGDCDDEYSTWGWCLGAGTSRACAISYGPDADAPCGAYDGPAGPTVGMSPIASGYKVALQSAQIQSALRTNWARLSTLSDAGLCCSAADVQDAAPCHVGKVLLLSQNPCNDGEYEFKCFGTATHGLCTAFSNEKNTTEIGQYYFVNFDENVPSPSQSAALSPTPSPNSPIPSPKKSSTNAAAIAVPVVLVVLLAIAVAAFLILRRRRRAARAAAHITSPHPFVAPSVAHATGGSPTTAGWPESSTALPMTQFGDSPASSHVMAGGKLARLYQQDSAAGTGEPQLPPYSLHPADQATFARR